MNRRVEQKVDPVSGELFIRTVYDPPPVSGGEWDRKDETEIKEEEEEEDGEEKEKNQERDEFSEDLVSQSDLYKPWFSLCSMTICSPGGVGQPTK